MKEPKVGDRIQVLTKHRYIEAQVCEVTAKGRIYANLLLLRKPTLLWSPPCHIHTVNEEYTYGPIAQD